jgi:uncharacterized membrane protein
MPSAARRFIRDYRQLAVVGSLSFATLVCAGLFLLRAAYTRSLGFIGLPWNLFLAWLPAVSALVAYNLSKRPTWLTWLVAPGAALAWLLFLPNAPYLVTDLIHLRPHGDVPYWFDLIMLAAFAWTGVFLGLVSLFLMQEVIRKMAGALASWLFVFAALGLSSFGIYLGRFLRWNSWDVFFNPLQLLADIAVRVRHPLANLQAYAFSILFAFFFLSVYLMALALGHLRHEGQHEAAVERTGPLHLADTARRRRSAWSGED